tara:strand:+ start:1788 stop:2204 length:417 start_codon:yes stop_codon:yes gene_type:complete
MKNLCIFSFLICIFFSVKADWKKLRDGRQFNLYTDLNKNQKEGDFVKIWLLSDYKSLQIINKNFLKNNKKKENYLSTVRKIILNCKNNSYRTINYRFMNENLGKGKIILELKGKEQNWDWEKIPKASTYGWLMKKNCK